MKSLTTTLSTREAHCCHVTVVYAVEPEDAANITKDLKGMLGERRVVVPVFDLESSTSSEAGVMSGP